MQFRKEAFVFRVSVGATFLVFRHFYVRAFCSRSGKANERQDTTDSAGRKGPLRPPKPRESGSPGAAEGPGWNTTG